MKNLFSLSCLLGLLLCGCEQKKNDHVLRFATSGDYPPFEFFEKEELKGFDVDVARLVAKELGKEVEFENMQYSSVLKSLQTGDVDAAISTITVTPERVAQFEFSDEYYHEKLEVVSKSTAPITKKEDLAGKKVAVQLGSTMEIWSKKNLPSTEVVRINNNNQGIESLKAGHVDAVILDGVQAHIFTQKNPGLITNVIGESQDGYAIALKKGSTLTADINKALTAIKDRGDIDALKKKWLTIEGK